MPGNVPHVAIIDYGMGNLFSVKRACEQVGLDASITQSKEDILKAAAVILPGVGAFGDAMQILESIDLVSVIKDVADSGRPLVGVCLGMQLLMSESSEFGRHPGLGIVEGEVIRIPAQASESETLKVPHVGWSRIHAAQDWDGSLLEDLPDFPFMYFVHSYYAVPVSNDVVLSRTQYGAVDFCSSFQHRNIFGCQFHPEKSGRRGLAIYKKLADTVGRINERDLHD